MEVTRPDEQVGQELDELMELLREAKARRKVRPVPSPLDPLALLERLLDAGLRCLERAVAQLVYALERRLKR